MGGSGSKKAKKKKQAAAEATAITVAGSPLTLEIRECTTTHHHDIKSSLFSRNSDIKSMTANSGAFFNMVSASATEGFELVASMVKVESPKMPSMGEAMQMSAAMMSGGTATMKQTVTQRLFFTKTDKKIETMQVNVAMRCNAKVRFCDMTANMDDGGAMATAITLGSQGWGLKGATLVGSAASTTGAGIMGAASTTNTVVGLIFQKVGDPINQELSAVQFSMTYRIDPMMTGRGGTDVPDFLKHLNEHGAAGWRLAGLNLTMQGGSSSMSMGMGMDPTAALKVIEMSVPFQVYMRRPASGGGASTFEYIKVPFHRTLTMEMAGMGVKMNMTGDEVPVIQQHAAAGWTFKGSLPLATESKRKGMMPVTYMPSLLIFEAEVKNAVAVASPANEIKLETVVEAVVL